MGASKDEGQTGLLGRPVRVLVACGDKSILERLNRAFDLSPLPTEVEEEPTGDVALARLAESEFDAFVVDHWLSDQPGLELVDRRRNIYYLRPGLPARIGQ